MPITLPKSTIDIENERKEFIQEIIDRYLYLGPKERKRYIARIQQLNSIYKVTERKLHAN